MARLFDNPKIREDLAKAEPAPDLGEPVAPSHRVTPKVPGSKSGARKGGIDDREP
jgi:hypothetical protein